MEKTQNITLSIPKDILRKAKILAIERNTSLSGLLTQSLVDLVKHHNAYEQARSRNVALLKAGLNLGTQGNLSWKRADLHERHTGK
jgi:hypothetical protein